MAGGADALSLARLDAAAVARGLPNLEAHLDNVRRFGFEPVVAVNQFASDSDEEIAAVESFCAARDVACARADAFGGGGEGCEALARLVVRAAAVRAAAPRFLYPLEDPPAAKIATIARALYGADGVSFIEHARADLDCIHRLGLDGLPVCVAKTQRSLGDDPAARGRPRGFSLTVRAIHPAVGAGFLVAEAGAISTMPGLPHAPAALDFDLDDGGVVRGLF